MNECKICKSVVDTRLGVCFDCANAESIIADGLDMWGKGKNGTDEPAKTAIEKLQMLVERGLARKK